METKKLCPVHYYKYIGRVCPICEKERIERMQARIDRKEHKNQASQEETDEAQYTMEDLMNKFNTSF